MVYFEICSTLSVVLRMLVANLVKPGVGMNINPAGLDTASIKTYTTAAQHHHPVEFLMNIVPNTIVGDAGHGNAHLRRPALGVPEIHS